METSEKSPSPSFQSSPLLPGDLLRKIFSLLPLKSLFRLRCLCKLWRSLPFSLLFSDTVAPSSPLLHHFWLFSFRLLARKVNEYRSPPHKAMFYTSYSIEYDREMMGSCGYALQLPFGDAGSDHTSLKNYEILDLSSPLVTLLKTGILDIVASVDGLLLLTLRLSQVHDHEENNLKVFVYNPISKNVRSLPATRYAPQKLAMTLSRDEKGISRYRVYSLGRSYRPRTKYLLYSMEVFDSVEAHNGWHFLSHVRANLSGRGDFHPANETAIMGYVNSKSISNELGFLYWMPCLVHRSSTGRHAELSSCHMTTGFLCGMPGLPFKTTFADMWPCPSGIKLVCGVAQGDDLSCTCGVEVWELVQGEGGFPEDDQFYGVVEHPLGTYWQPCERMPQDLWDHLTCKSTCRIACIVCSFLVLVVAEKEEEHMVVYDTNDTTWKLAQLWPLLQDLFQDKHSEYYRVYPWIMNFTPDASALV